MAFTAQCCFPKKDQSLNHQVRCDCLMFAAEVSSAAVSLDMDTVSLDKMELVKNLCFLSAVVGVLQGAPEVDVGGDHAGESALAQVLLQSCCSCRCAGSSARLCAWSLWQASKHCAKHTFTKLACAHMPSMVGAGHAVHKPAAAKAAGAVGIDQLNSSWQARPQWGRQSTLVCFLVVAVLRPSSDESCANVPGQRFRADVGS